MKPHRILFYLTIFFLPAQLGYHFWPEWSLVLGRRLDYLAPTVYLTDIFILFTIVSYLSGSLVNFKYQILNLYSKYKIYLLGVAGFVILNVLFSRSPGVAIYYWLKVTEFVLFGIYIIKTKPAIPYITLFLSLAVLYSSVIAIFQFYFQHSLGGIFWWLGERTFSTDTPGIARYNLCLINGCREVLRSYATFPHPNVLGGFLAVMLPLIWSQSTCKENNVFTKCHCEVRFLADAKQSSDKEEIATPSEWSRNDRLQKIYKSIYILISFIGVIALVLTFSRSAWVVAMIGLSVTVLESRIRHHGFRIKQLIIVILCLIPVSYFIIRFGATIYSDSESVIVRNELNVAAISMWVHSPVFGAGLGNFTVNLPEYLIKHKVYFLQPVHNIYLLLFSETGITGVIMIFFAFIKPLVQGKKYQGKIYIQNTRLFIPTFGILMLGLFDHYPLTLQQGQLFTTVIVSLLFL